VDGLYTADPRREPDAAHLAVVDSLTPQVMAMGSGPNGEAGVGSGGMATKLQAAAIARSAGCATVITLGSRPHPVTAVEAGERATLITAGAGPLAAYKQWIAGALKPKGVLIVDDGAAAALLAGRSLLPSGISGVEGPFRKGDCVLVRDRSGADIAVGLVNFAADEVARIRGRRTEELEALLGYKSRSEVVHRDDLVEFSSTARRAS
jgi:glutamate 5-kinase